MKHGLYETFFGNCAEYTGGSMAWDLDAGMEIPIEFLEGFIRECD